METKVTLVFTLILAVFFFVFSHFRDEKNIQMLEGVCAFIFLITVFWVLILTLLKRKNTLYPIMGTIFGFFIFVTVPYVYIALWYEILHICSYGVSLFSVAHILKPKNSEIFT